MGRYQPARSIGPVSAVDVEHRVGIERVVQIQHSFNASSMHGNGFGESQVELGIARVVSSPRLNQLNRGVAPEVRARPRLV